MGDQGANFPLPGPDPCNTVSLIQPDVIWCAQEERLQDKSLHVGLPEKRDSEKLKKEDDEKKKDDEELNIGFFYMRAK